MSFTFRHLPTTSEADATENFQQLQALLAQPAWLAPTLTNSWTAYGPPYAPPGYLKDALGFVHLHGAIKGGVSTSSAFLLPEGFRPANPVIAANVQNGGEAAGLYIEITEAGNVLPIGSEVTAFTSLDIAPFLAER